MGPEFLLTLSRAQATGPGNAGRSSPASRLGVPTHPIISCPNLLNTCLLNVHTACTIQHVPAQRPHSLHNATRACATLGAWLSTTALPERAAELNVNHFGRDACSCSPLPAAELCCLPLRPPPPPPSNASSGLLPIRRLGCPHSPTGCVLPAIQSFLACLQLRPCSVSNIVERPAYLVGQMLQQAFCAVSGQQPGTSFLKPAAALPAGCSRSMSSGSVYG